MRTSVSFKVWLYRDTRLDQLATDTKRQSYLHKGGELNDEALFKHLRVTSTTFAVLVDLIHAGPSFKPSGRRSFRRGTQLHLLIYGDGNTSSKLAQFFSMGKGSAQNYILRTCTAIMRLRDTMNA